MRTMGVLACLYTVAYFVTTMSVAALSGVAFNSGPTCVESGCVSIAGSQRHNLAASDDAPLWTAATYLPLD